MERSELARLVNEFTDIRLSLIETKGGNRIQIESLRTGDQAVFDPTVLEALASLGDDALAGLVGAFTEFGDASMALTPEWRSPHAG